MKSVIAFLQGSGKEAVSPLMLLGILFVTVLALIYFMNEGYLNASEIYVDASGNIRRKDSVSGLFRYVLATDASGNSASTKKDASGNTTKSSTDGSGNLISLSLSDLIKALAFANKSEKPEDVLNPPVFGPSTNVLPVTVSGGSLSSESEKRIAQQISKNIKDEMLAQRSTIPVLPASGDCSNDDSCNDSAACSQGAQYGCNGGGAGAPFDSSDYIRKDSIPCWGCKLPQ